MLDVVARLASLQRRAARRLFGRRLDPGVRLDPARRLKLLFVHVPKTGGQSVGRAIVNSFGERLYNDYADRPTNPAAPTNFDPIGYLEAAHASGYPWLVGMDAVMGHFWSRKYDPVQFEIRATVLREPISRALSLYSYWLAKRVPPNAVRQHLVDNKLDFLAFARMPLINRFYVDHMFRDADMTRFNFIGDQARLRADWAGAIGRMGMSAPEVRENETRGLDPGYPGRAHELLEDPARMARLRDLFAADLDFYERWAEH